MSLVARGEMFSERLSCDPIDLDNRRHSNWLLQSGIPFLSSSSLILFLEVLTLDNGLFDGVFMWISPFLCLSIFISIWHSMSSNNDGMMWEGSTHALITLPRSTTTHQRCSTVAGIDNIYVTIDSNFIDFIPTLLISAFHFTLACPSVHTGRIAASADFTDFTPCFFYFFSKNYFCACVHTVTKGTLKIKVMNSTFVV